MNLEGHWMELPGMEVETKEGLKRSGACNTPHTHRCAASKDPAPSVAGKGAIDPCRDRRYPLIPSRDQRSLAIPRPLVYPPSSVVTARVVRARALAKIVHRVARVGRVTQVL